MEPGCSLQCSQESATGPYPEPGESNQQPLTLFLKNPGEIFSSATWSQTSSMYVLPLGREVKFRTYTKQQEKNYVF
jgi:hypothetical protein